jgi:hypothetical protein
VVREEQVWEDLDHSAQAHRVDILLWKRPDFPYGIIGEPIPEDLVGEAAIIQPRVNVARVEEGVVLIADRCINDNILIIRHSQLLVL